MLYGLASVIEAKLSWSRYCSELLYLTVILSPAILSVSATLLFALRTSFTVGDRAGVEQRDAA